MKLSGSPTRDIRGGHTTPTEAETKATVPGGVHPILNSGPCDLISSLIYSRGQIGTYLNPAGLHFYYPREVVKLLIYGRGNPQHRRQTISLGDLFE